MTTTTTNTVAAAGKTPIGTSHRGNATTPVDMMRLKAGSSLASPLDQTVAETPSPSGNMTLMTPATLHVKLIDSSVATRKNQNNQKPFDESPAASPVKPFDQLVDEGDDDDAASWESAENRDGANTEDGTLNSSAYFKCTSRMYLLSQMVRDFPSPDRMATVPPSPSADSESSTGSPVGLPAAEAAPITLMSPLAAEIAAAARGLSPPSPPGSPPQCPPRIAERRAVQVPETISTAPSSPPSEERLAVSPEYHQISRIRTIDLAPSSPSSPRLGILPSTFPVDSNMAASFLSPPKKILSPADPNDIPACIPSRRREAEIQVVTTPSTKSAVLPSSNSGSGRSRKNLQDGDPVVPATPTSNDDASSGFIKPHSLFASAKKESVSSSSSFPPESSRRIEVTADSPDELDEIQQPFAEDDDDSISTQKTPDDEPGHIFPTPMWLTMGSDELNDSKGSDTPFDCINDFSAYYNGDISFIQEEIDEEELLDIEAGVTSPNASKKFFSVNKIFRSPVAAAPKSVKSLKSRETPHSLKQRQARSALAPPREGPIVVNELKDSNYPQAPPAVIEFKTQNKKDSFDAFEDEPLASVSFSKNHRLIGTETSFEGMDRFHIRGESQSPKKVKKTTSKKTNVAGGRHWTCTALYIMILLTLISSGAIVGLFLGGIISFDGWSSSANVGELNSTADNESGSSGQQGTNLFEGSEVVACTNAEPLLDMNRTYYGSNWKAFWDETIDQCGDQMSIGYAVWYSYETDASQLVEASTCGESDFDTQITVMSGTCGALTCVSFNDQACGDQSRVSFYAEAGTTYYIMIHGYREASGTFGLTMKQSTNHDDCAKAVGSIQPRSVMAGTTSGAKRHMAPVECGGIDTSSPGVWYTIKNWTGFFRAEVLRGYTDFHGQVAIYRSMDDADAGCSALICDQGSATGNVTWLAEANEEYFVFVNGKDGTSGDFDLFVGPNSESSCHDATSLDPNTIGYLASTLAANPQNVESCGYTGYHTSPGVWFSVEGTDEILRVSTCGSLDDLDTQISVFGGDCDSMYCMGGTGQDLPCGDNGSVSWNTEQGNIYHIYVSGRSSRVGEFVLNISEVSRKSGFSCFSSLTLESNSTSIFSSTLDAPSHAGNTCDDFGVVRGVWHEISGNGKTMNISLCNDETDFDARVSLYTGSCDGSLECVAHTSSLCEQNSELLVTTHVGVSYYLFVHGAESFTVGNYRLTVDESVINDSCQAAATLDVTPAKYFGSTLSAAMSTSIECAGSDGETIALWYTFAGTGETVTFSTCSNQTDFHTDITVFSGSCSMLSCVANAHDICGSKSGIGFLTAANETYFVRIGGNSTDDVGNFVMNVTNVSPFFGT